MGKKLTFTLAQDSLSPSPVHCSREFEVSLEKEGEGNAAVSDDSLSERTHRRLPSHA
jgi:hypothetical protein